MDLTAKEDRQPRHADLFEAINNNLSRSVGKLEALRDRIAGQEKPPQTEAPVNPTPSPAEVYENSPGVIRDYSGQICDLTDEIRKMVV